MDIYELKCVVRLPKDTYVVHYDNGNNEIVYGLRYVFDCSLGKVAVAHSMAPSVPSFPD